MDRFHKLSVIALVCLSVSLGWMSYVAATPSPAQNLVCEPGGCNGPQACTDNIWLDGTTPVDTRYHASQVVGTAGQDVNAFWTSVLTANPQSFCFQPGTTYNIGSAVNFAQDTSVFANGATFKWTAAAPGANLAVFDNSASINLRWSGGTFDENTVDEIFFGFGSSILSNPSFALTSAGIRDLRIINVVGSAMLMNMVSNKNIYISNFYSLKSSSGNGDDTNELMGSNTWFQGDIDQNNVAASGITTASLHNSTWWVTVDRSTNGAGTPDVGLQPFAPPVGDEITDVNLWVKGSVVAVNGNLASGSIAGQNINIHGEQGSFVELGTNGGGASSGGEVWKQVTIDGSWILKRNFQMFDYNGLSLQNMIVAGTTSLSGVNGIFYLTGTNAADRINDNLVVSNVVFTNVTAAMAGAFFWAQNSGNNKVGNATFTGGSIKGQSVSLASSNYVTAGIGTVSLLIQNVFGFNPQAVSSFSQASPYTNSDGYLEFLTVTTVNGATAMTCNGAAIGNPIVGTVCSLPPGKAVSWATANPTFEKQPT